MARNWNENQGRENSTRQHSGAGRQQNYQDNTFDRNRNIKDRNENSYSQRYGVDRDFIDKSEFSEYSGDSDRTQGNERSDRGDKYGGYRAQENRGIERHDRDRSLNRDFETYGARGRGPQRPDYKQDPGMNQRDGFDRNFSGSRRDPVLDGYSDYSRQPSDRGMGRDRSSRSFRGLGPKSYRKSDESLKDDISEILMYHIEIDATEIEIEVSEGVVTLTGTVEDKWMKYHAEDVIENLSFVNSVQNNIRVSKNKMNSKDSYDQDDDVSTLASNEKSKKTSTSDKKSMNKH